MRFKFNKKGWEQVAKHIIETEGVDRMRRVADASNREAGITDGYMVSAEGDDVLRKRDYRATVITATGEAIRDNAETNRLVTNLHLAQ